MLTSPSLPQAALGTRLARAADHGSGVMVRRSMHPAFWKSVLATGALLAWGCAAGESEQFESKVGSLFADSCTEGCHDAQTREAGLDLSPGNASLALIRVSSTQASLLLVEPGDPQASYLWHKLNGTHLSVGGEGETMPYAAKKLPNAQLEELREAITALSR